MRLSKELREEIVKKIIEAVKPKKIILFGSYAYGEPTKYSDIDLLIVEENVESKIKEKIKIRKSLENIKISKDILVVSEGEYEFYKNDFGSVIKEACDKGAELWSI
jgi:uncharacterized protein